VNVSAIGGWAILAGLVGTTGPLSCAEAGGEIDYQAARADMVRAIEQNVRYTRAEIGKPELDPRVIRAMATVPRHEFVPPFLQGEAYENHPLPIGHGQTISQPYIVALMTDLAAPEPGDVVLEVGTGSGYQAAILAGLVSEVYTIEIVEPLGEEARERLQRLGYANVEVRIGDGFFGWPEAAPFDAIIITAATPRLPDALRDQLRANGRYHVETY